ncbi:acyl-CoA thioesterase [Flavobacteriaceae bacterium]|jgi:acyl-CoA thioester hydrolase|nr:acyl-CoA thioesterase [Flavobacteriaceae bacterium]
MYTKKFEIRWSDLDANLHLGNSKYIDFMSHTRMSFLIKNNLDLGEMVKSNLGPITLHEHIYYFKEVRPNESIIVSLEVSGFTPDGRFLKFEHNFYDKEGRNLAYAEILFSWIDMKKRKIGTISKAFLNKIESLPRAENFKFLSKEDLKSKAMTPKNLIIS